MIMKKIWFMCFVLAWLPLVAWANFSENFEGYSLGALIPQTSVWSGTSSAWSVVDDGTGNKVLELNTGVEYLRYAGSESFVGSGDGYTMFAKVKYHTVGYAQRSGLVIDQAAAAMNGYNGRRLELGGNGTPGSVDVYTAWATSTGTGGTVADSWNYVRIYRSGMDANTNQGGSLQIYISAAPFNAANPGTLIFTGSVPDTDPFVSVGDFSLWGLKLDPAEKVYFDDIAAFSGDVAYLSTTVLTGFAETFEGYSLGALIPQTSVWSGTSSAWSVVDDGTGNKVLKLTPGSGSQELSNIGSESFIGSGAGYTMFAKVKWETTGYGDFDSGFVIDKGVGAFNGYNGRGVKLAGGTAGAIKVWTSWGNTDGTAGVAGNTWTYLRLYRSGMDASINDGGSLQIYVSSTPFSAINSGTLIFTATGRGPVPDTDAFVSVGKFSLNGLSLDSGGTTYYDDIAAYDGYVMWPASILVCGDSNHPNPVVDLNGDCYVDMSDLSVMAQNWLECTDPLPPCSYNP
jgi:hypothetical protein